MSQPPADVVSEIEARSRSASLISLFLDFDGTLVPISEDPAAPRLDPGAADTLHLLSSQNRFVTTIISGRAIEDLYTRIRLTGLIYAGNHCLEPRRSASESALWLRAFYGQRDGHFWTGGDLRFHHHGGLHFIRVDGDNRRGRHLHYQSDTARQLQLGRRDTREPKLLRNAREPDDHLRDTFESLFRLRGLHGQRDRDFGTGGDLQSAPYPGRR